jgi:hypothetical protein
MKKFFQNINNKKQINILFIALVIYSITFWIASLNKDFHINEFQSWVYAQKCTFQQILLLHDTGIGHPPFYHLLQKFVQSIFEHYHPFQVRIANFIIGLIFILSFTSYLLKKNVGVLFCLGIVCSGGVLNAFVFSRMWGLVLLFSLFLLWRGEKYCEEGNTKNLIYLMFVFSLGMFADYSFILLLPFCVFIIISKYLSPRKLQIGFFGLFTGLWILSKSLYIWKEGGISTLFMYNSIMDFTKIFYELNLIFFKWQFQEYALISFLILIFLFLLLYRSRNLLQNPNLVNKDFLFLSGVLLVLGFLDSLIRADVLRVRYVFIVLILILILLFKRRKIFQNLFVNKYDSSVFIGIFGALIMLLSISPFFWKDLRDSRYLMILFPFIIVLTIRNFPKKYLHKISALLFISGLLFIFSGAVDGSYPPPKVENKIPVVFSSALSYSTQYLRSQDQTNEYPYLLDFTHFKDFCRVCEMGTDQIPFQDFDSFQLVAENGFGYQDYIPVSFKLSDSNEIYQFRIEKYCYRYLKPVRQIRFGTYHFVRTGN